MLLPVALTHNTRHRLCKKDTNVTGTAEGSINPVAIANVHSRYNTSITKVRISRTIAGGTIPAPTIASVTRARTGEAHSTADMLGVAFGRS